MIPANRLDQEGLCPHCQRPLLGLANNTCGACRGSLEAHWQTSPEVASRLETLAPGWSPATLAAWFAPLPGDLAWALRTRTFAPLGWFMDPDLAEGQIRLRTRLEDRGRESWLDDEVAVEGVRLAALSDFRPLLGLRVWGNRTETQGPRAGETAPFLEFWFLRPTGVRLSPASAVPHCPACGAPAGLRRVVCTRCGCGMTFQPGPWQVLGLQSVQATPGGHRSIGLAVGLGLVP